MPIPFNETDTPPFPTEDLPGPLAAFVECLAESTQTPEEMAGILSLGVLATAFQSKFTVEITPDWREPLCLYCVAVAPPGERKSAVISALTKPIYEFEAEQREPGGRGDCPEPDRKGPSGKKLWRQLKTPQQKGKGNFQRNGGGPGAIGTACTIPGYAPFPPPGGRCDPRAVDRPDGQAGRVYDRL